MADHDVAYFLGKLSRWLAAQDASPTGFDIIRTGDFEVLAGYAIHAVGSARLSYPIGLSEGRRAIDFDKSFVGNPAMRVFAGLASAWKLAPEEKVALLGIESVEELVTIENGAMENVPAAIIERLVSLLNIFQAINTLLPNAARADQWIRSPNTGAPFGGRTALKVMSESPDGIWRVEQYLNAQVSSS